MGDSLNISNSGFVFAQRQQKLVLYRLSLSFGIEIGFWGKNWQTAFCESLHGIKRVRCGCLSCLPSPVDKLLLPDVLRVYRSERNWTQNHINCVELKRICSSTTDWSRFWFTDRLWHKWSKTTTRVSESLVKTWLDANGSRTTRRPSSVNQSVPSFSHRKVSLCIRRQRFSLLILSVCARPLSSPDAAQSCVAVQATGLPT